jgi:dTDP-4-dehydrorhamnose 3,5-epimerase
MKFTPLNLSGAFLIDVETKKDNRGEFFRVIGMDELKQINHTKEFVQVNRSVNYKKGTLRGMHFQNPPHAEIKIVQCIKGKVFDAIVDLRRNSETFLKWAGVELSEENRNMIYIPEGFAHGFQTLEDNSELIYFHTEFYTPESEDAICFSDPLINIEWKIPVAVISDRDKSIPLLVKNFKGIEL